MSEGAPSAGRESAGASGGAPSADRVPSPGRDPPPPSGKPPPPGRDPSEGPAAFSRAGASAACGAYGAGVSSQELSGSRGRLSQSSIAEGGGAPPAGLSAMCPHFPRQARRSAGRERKRWVGERHPRGPAPARGAGSRTRPSAGAGVATRPGAPVGGARAKGVFRGALPSAPRKGARGSGRPRSRPRTAAPGGLWRTPGTVRAEPSPRGSPYASLRPADGRETRRAPGMRRPRRAAAAGHRRRPDPIRRASCQAPRPRPRPPGPRKRRGGRPSRAPRRAPRAGWAPRPQAGRRRGRGPDTRRRRGRRTPSP